MENINRVITNENGTTSAFDENGNCIHDRYSDGTEMVYIYNDNDRIIAERSVDVDGIIHYKEFSEDGILIYYRNSIGYTASRTNIKKS